MPRPKQTWEHQGGHDQQGGGEQHQRADRVDGGGDPEADRGVDAHRQRLGVDAGREEREHEVVEDQREDQQPRAEQSRRQHGEGDQSQGLERSAAQVARRLLHLQRDASQAAAHDHRHVGDREGDLGEDDGGHRELEPDAGEQQQRGDTRHDLGRHEGEQRDRADDPAAPRPDPFEAEREHRAQHQRADRRDGGDLQAGHEGIEQRAVVHQGVVPLQAEAGERRQRLLVVEAEQPDGQDRQVQPGEEHHGHRYGEARLALQPAGPRHHSSRALVEVARR